MGKIVQFETSAANLLLSILEQVRKQNFCITNDFPSPAGVLFVSGFDWYLGWVRKSPTPENIVISIREIFNNDPLIRYLSINRVQLIQPVQVSLSTKEQLLAAGGSVPATTAKVDLYLVFSLQASEVDNDCFLSVGLQDIEGLPADNPNFQDLKNQIQKLFSTKQIPLDVGALSTLGGKPKVANIGVTAFVPSNATTSVAADELTNATTIAGSVVVVRIELGNYPTTTNAWEDFYNNTQNVLNIGKTGKLQKPTASPRRWALFTDQVFITDSTRQGVEDSFKSSGKFKLQGGISTNWSAPDSRALINLDFYGKAIDACDLGVFGSSDIRVRVNVPIEFSVIPEGTATVYKPGTLQQQVKINFWKNDWDTALCVLGSTLIWPYLGVKLMEENKLSWPEYELSLVFGPFVFIPILIEANKGGKLPSPKETCERPDSHKDEFVCKRPYDSGSNTFGGRPYVEDYLGLPDGLELYGAMFWNKRLSRRERLVSINSFGWRIDPVHFSCANVSAAVLALISEHPEDFAFYRMQVAVDFELPDWDAANDQKEISYSKTDKIEGAVCLTRIRPEDDPLNVFTPFLNGSEIKIPITKVPDAYFANSYPCKLLIHTSDGTRMVTLPPITKETEEKIRTATLRAWADAVSSCYAKSKLIADPRWIIDPPDVYRERHDWNVIVNGLRAGERVRLEDSLGRIVASVRADRQGRALLQTLLLPQSYDGQLCIRRSAPVAPAPIQAVDENLNFEDIRPEEFVVPEDYIAIDVKQIQLLQRSEIQMAEPFQALTPVLVEDRSALLVAQRSGLTLYDLSTPDQPRLMAQVELPGMLGVLVTSREFLTWGRDGIYALTVDAEGAIVEHLSERNVSAMATLGDQIFVLHDGRLEVWDQNRQTVEVFEVPGAHLLAATDSQLLLGSESGVTIFAASGRGNIRSMGAYPFEGLTRILTSELVGVYEQVLLQGDTRAELLDLSNPDRIAVLETYREVPESYAFLLHRDLLIEKDAEARSIKLYTVGATAWA